MALAIMSCADFPEIPYLERTRIYGEPYLDTRDIYEYKTVVIGNQTWMAENLIYNKDVEYVCYAGALENCKKYGPLYEFAVAKTICPIGWKLPSNEDWETLVKNSGGAVNSGHRLKAETEWEGGGNGSDLYGFKALPGGFIDEFNQSYQEGHMAFLWSSTEVNEGIFARGISSEKIEGVEIVRITVPKTGAKLSVRCLKEN